MNTQITAKPTSFINSCLLNSEPPSPRYLEQGYSHWRLRLLWAVCISLVIVLLFPHISIAGTPSSPDGFITARAYMNCGPSIYVSGLLADTNFPNSPDMVVYTPYFELWALGAITNPPPSSSGYTNYGAQIYGYFYPPVTTNYTFYICSDDNSQLFLSTDESPANKLLIAEETGWSNTRQYTNSAGTSALQSKRSDQFAGTQWPSGNTITLTQGTAYYIEALMKQGGGGDNLSVSIDGINPISGSLLSSFEGNVETQPQNVARVNNNDPWSVTINNGITNIVAGGADVWDTNWTSVTSCGPAQDGFVFDYLPVTGDFDYRLRVISMTDPSASGWSKCGLMARGSLTPGSSHIYCFATPPQGHNSYVEQGRDLPGGCSWADSGSTPPTPYPNAWLRLRREGPVFRSYWSTDGNTWQQFDSHDTSANGTQPGFPQNLQLGIATTAHNDDATVPGATVTAQVSDFGPFFTLAQQPISQQAIVGSTVTFSVSVTNVQPSDVQYQWLFNGSPIAGATSNQLVLSNVTTNNNGAYSARMTYVITGDVLTTTNATLSVSPFVLNVYTAVELRFVTTLGVNYQIQASPDLVTWTNVPPAITGTGQFMSVFESTRGVGYLYYRLTTP